jgi:hypothetical protein
VLLGYLVVAEVVAAVVGVAKEEEVAVVMVDVVRGMVQGMGLVAVKGMVEDH